ncbi:unnamed protein product, partial [marine sediment metagenome]
HPIWGSWYDFIDSITAPDKYTVRVDFKFFDAAWTLYLGFFCGTSITPPEVVEAGPDYWFNQVGTGPFILTEYVTGSHVAYERNPDYRGTTTINGKEYQLPFIDKLIYPVIPDESTQVAALRTGTLDMWPRVPLMYEDTLTSYPGLVQERYLTGRVSNLVFAAYDESKVFYKREVRRAMMIATDLEAIRDAIFFGGDVHCFPISRGPLEYTPMEELPESTRELFDYDPVKAKQMLADAGYPDGFECEFLCGTTALGMDVGAMLKEQWDKIGVDV